MLLLGRMREWLETPEAEYHCIDCDERWPVPKHEKERLLQQVLRALTE